MPDHLWTGLVFTPSLSGTASDLRTSRASRRSPRGPGWTLNRPAHNGSLPRFPICAALASWPLEGPYGPSAGPEHRSQPVGLSVTRLRGLAGRTAAHPGPRTYPLAQELDGQRPLAPGPAERSAGHPGTRAAVRPPWKDRAVSRLPRGGPTVSHARRRQRKFHPGHRSGDRPLGLERSSAPRGPAGPSGSAASGGVESTRGPQPTRSPSGDSHGGGLVPGPPAHTGQRRLPAPDKLDYRHPVVRPPTRPLPHRPARRLTHARRAPRCPSLGAAPRSVKRAR